MGGDLHPDLGKFPASVKKAEKTKQVGKPTTEGRSVYGKGDSMCLGYR